MYYHSANLTTHSIILLRIHPISVLFLFVHWLQNIQILHNYGNLINQLKNSLFLMALKSLSDLCIIFYIGLKVSILCGLIPLGILIRCPFDTTEKTCKIIERNTVKPSFPYMISNILPLLLTYFSLYLSLLRITIN